MTDILKVIQSVQVPQLIKDSFIAQGHPIINGRGDSEHYVGGFAVVFPFMVKGEKWAFRCWTADLGNMERRLKTIAEELGKLGLPYFTELFYEPEGIVIDGKLYPTTRMKWVDGENLKQYICIHKNDKKKLLALSDEFRKMCDTLHQNRISHGDLQHGNILVSTKGEISLIDYDSLYTPAIKGMSDIIAGSRGYQHPSRKNNKLANEKVDYFSELAIYLSIIAIAEDPTLVDDYSVADSDWLLFAPESFDDLTSSSIYQRLRGTNDETDRLLSIMLQYLSLSSVEDLEPFGDVYDRMLISFDISTPKIRKGKESANLQWTIKKADKVVLYADGNELQECSLQGRLSVSPDMDTEYRLDIYLPNGKVEHKLHKLLVREECSAVFRPDREYTMRDIPFTLKWDVQNAVKVVFLGKEVSKQGEYRVTDGVEKETEYSLYVTDDFEDRVFTTKIRMLPIPVIQSLITHTPDFTHHMSVGVNMPIVFSEPNPTQLNLPEIEYEDILKSVPNMLQSGNYPHFTLPQFELPVTFTEKIEGCILHAMENICSSIETFIDRQLKKHTI